MGGFGSGGARAGAGRKSKREKDRKVSGARSRTAALDAGVPASPAVVPIPDGLTPAQAVAWLELAPFAEAAGTLVPASAGAFRDLCEVVALRRSILATLATDGLMTANSEGVPVAHPLLTHERQYRLREEAGKARFMVLPTGKPMVAKKEDADPFAEFDQPAPMPDAPKGTRH